jgi:phosphate transport system ATP-binding protein
MTHISIRNLNVEYGSHHALKDISVDIPDGGTTAIIGPSGCGKTTLLKSINRLIELNDEITVRGKVLIDNVDIYDSKADLLSLRKKIGFLSQKPYPLPMSIYNNVTYGPRIHRTDSSTIQSQLAEVQKHCPLPENGSAPFNSNKNKNGKYDHFVEYYLRLAGLWGEVKDRLHHPANRLSVGQQQRLALARAIAVGPDVILADEPTSALDPTSARLIEEQFQRLKQNFSIVLVTHSLQQAMRLADYVVFLYFGEVIEHGSARVVFEQPKEKVTREFITSGFGEGSP